MYLHANHTSFLLDWIRPVPGDVYKASCSVCDVILPAHRQQLKQHAENDIHIKNGSQTVSKPAGSHSATVHTGKHLI